MCLLIHFREVIFYFTISVDDVFGACVGALFHEEEYLLG